MTLQDGRWKRAARWGVAVGAVMLVAAAMAYRAAHPELAPGYTKSGMASGAIAEGTSATAVPAGARIPKPDVATTGSPGPRARAAMSTNQVPSPWGSTAAATVYGTYRGEAVGPGVTATVRTTPDQGTATRSAFDPRSPASPEARLRTPTPASDAAAVGSREAARSVASRSTSSAPRLPDGATTAQPPFLLFARPFAAAYDVLPSRYYPYGSDAGGQYLLHHGVDIGNPNGTPVLAVADGLVVYAGRDDTTLWGPTADFYGQLVVLRHAASIDGRPLTTLYGHVSRTLVAAGEEVKEGQPIAEVGAEGIALGPHLHLEVRTRVDDYGATVNPELLLRTLPGHGLIVGRVVDGSGRRIPDLPIVLYADTGDGSEAWRAQTTTYPDAHVNAAAGWQESFVFGDLPAGRYRIVAGDGDVRASEPATVTNGTAWIVSLRAMPLQPSSDRVRPSPDAPTPTATIPPKARRPN